MPTTTHGLVYPDSTGHTRLWEHLQNLANSTETALANFWADTGWTNLTLNSGHISAGTTPQIRVYRNVLYVTGNVKPSSGTYTANFTVTPFAAVSTTFRPPTTSTSLGKILAGNGANVAHGFINASGIITLIIGGTAMSAVNLDGLSGYAMV